MFCARRALRLRARLHKVHQDRASTRALVKGVKIVRAITQVTLRLRKHARVGKRHIKIAQAMAQGTSSIFVALAKSMEMRTLEGSPSAKTKFNHGHRACVWQTPITHHTTVVHGTYR